VSIGKLGAWFLLMIISFVLVTLVHRPRPLGENEQSGTLSRLIFNRRARQPAE